MKDNLWPDDIAVPKRPEWTPEETLRRQAEGLAKRTEGKLRARIDRGFVNEKLVLDFVVVVPALDGYEYRLFKILYKPTAVNPLYEIVVVGTDKILRAKSRHDFEAVLRGVLSSPGIRDLIQELLGYTKARGSSSSKDGLEVAIMRDSPSKGDPGAAIMQDSPSKGDPGAAIMQDSPSKGDMGKALMSMKTASPSSTRTRHASSRMSRR